MRERIISAAFLIVLIAAVVLLSLKFTIFIDLFVALICACSVFEFCKAVKTLGVFQISLLSMVFSFVHPMLMPYGITIISCYVYTILMLCMLIFFHEKISFKDFAYTFSMTLIITVSLSLIISMKDADPQHSTMYFVMAIAVPWLADVGAYFTGVFLGKHKLCPKISPKKTIEGAVGGVAFCTVATIIVAFLFCKLIYADEINIDYFNVMIIGFGGSLLSILGDLSFSVIKRSYSVKDYGDLIPGHGGILDRFDSVICFVPFMYIIITYLPMIIPD